MNNKCRSNHYIVNNVARTYKVINLIHKLIQNSYLDNTDKDLEQYVYLTLLKLNNDKLNELYHTKKLRNFISQIIKNQRNSGKFYKSLKSNDLELDISIEIPDEIEHNFLLDFVMDEIESINFFITGRTQGELRTNIALTVLSLYILRGTPKWRLCLEFSIGISTLNLLLKDAKSYIRNKYEKEFDEYVENKKGELNSPF